MAGIQKHTPTPWCVLGKNTGYIDGTDGKGWVGVAKVGDYRDKELLPFNKDRWDADCAFIVRACNSHEALVRALADLHREANLHAGSKPAVATALKAARAALKAAEEQ
jgi:hypothetical protein